MTTVILIDDHPIVRAGMKTVLNAAPDITVIAEGSTGEDALNLVKGKQPDVLVLDLNLPDINGLEVTRKLVAQGEPTAILVLTAHEETQMIFSLLESGATGYVLKDEALETLAHAVHAAARGQSWLSPTVASKVIQRAGLREQQPPAGADKPLQPESP